MPGQTAHSSGDAPPEDHRMELQQELLTALMKRNSDNFQLLLANPKVDLHYNYSCPPFPEWGTCLEIASRLKPERPEFVDALLRAKVKPNVNIVLKEPIHYAAQHGYHKTLKILLQDKRTKINAVDSKGRTALHYASIECKGSENQIKKYERCIALLLAQPGFNPNIPNNNGFTAIHAAAFNSTIDGVKAILRYGTDSIDLDSHRANGQTARTTILQKLKKLEGDLPHPKIELSKSDPLIQLLEAFQQGQINVFQKLLRQVDSNGNACVDPNYIYGNPYNATCLAMACKEDKALYVKALLDAGSDPNQVIKSFKKKMAPIHMAAENCYVKSMSVLLVNKGLNINLGDLAGNSALHLLAKHNEKEQALQCMKLLLSERHKYSININQLNSKKYSPLDEAIENKSFDMIRLILKSCPLRIDLDRILPDGTTTRQALLELVNNQTLKDIVLPERAQVAKTTKVDQKQILFNHLQQQDSKTFLCVLQEYSKAGDADILDIINDENGPYTYLQYATSNNLEMVVSELLDYKADPNMTALTEKRPPLVIACIQRYHSIVDMLLEHAEAINIGAVDTKGNTALHYAAASGDLQLVVNLMNHGADINIKNVFDKPPLLAADVMGLLNDCLRTNDSFPSNDDYELIFDYSLLLAHRHPRVQEDTKEEVNENPVIPMVRQENTPEADEDCPMIPMKEEVVLPEAENELPKEDEDTFLQSIGMIMEDEEATQDIELSPMIKQGKSKVERNVMKKLRVRKTHLDKVTPEMDFLFHISQFKNNDAVLKHPIINNFLRVKWQKFKYIFYFNFTFYSLFVILLNVHILLGHYQSVTTITLPILIFFLIYLTFRELVQLVASCFSSPWKYWKNLENVLDWGVIVTTALVLGGSDWHIADVFSAIAIFLSWLEFVLIIGRFPTMAKNIEMFKTVSWNCGLLLLSYSAILVGFAFSFYTLLNHRSVDGRAPPNAYFDNPFTSLFKTIIMMTGEFEADGIPFSSDSIVRSLVAHLLFVFFLFMIVIVLLNLMTGLAVSDTQTIKAEADKLSIVSRVRLIYEIENTILQCNNILRKCLSKERSHCKYLIRWLDYFFIFSGVKETDRVIKLLPNRGGEIILPRKRDADDSLRSDENSVQVLANEEGEVILPSLDDRTVTDDASSINDKTDKDNTSVNGGGDREEDNSLNSPVRIDVDKPSKPTDKRDIIRKGFRLDENTMLEAMNIITNKTCGGNDTSQKLNTILNILEGHSAAIEKNQNQIMMNYNQTKLMQQDLKYDLKEIQNIMNEGKKPQKKCKRKKKVQKVHK